MHSTNTTFSAWILRQRHPSLAIAAVFRQAERLIDLLSFLFLKLVA
jgi:hypothetical protein